MRLRGIEFGHVTDASGVRGWFGEGQPFHRFFKPFGLRFAGSTLVAKTTTIDARAGNLPLKSDRLTPRGWVPACVRVRPARGVVLNAVGLSGPGLRFLLDDGRWQRLTEPFFISFMAVAETAAERLDEARRLVDMLRPELARFAAPVGLQVNFSCPNVGVAGQTGERDGRLDDMLRQLDEYQALGIPVMPKLSVTAPVEWALRLQEHPACDAICVSNTVPWGALPERIDWTDLFGSTSPLARFGGGGLSGAPLLPLVAEWVRAARARGFDKPVNAGGGILGPGDPLVLLDAGASSVFIGTIAILRPWRVQRTIDAANRAFAARLRTAPAERAESVDGASSDARHVA